MIVLKLAEVVNRKTGEEEIRSDQTSRARDLGHQEYSACCSEIFQVGKEHHALLLQDLCHRRHPGEEVFFRDELSAQELVELPDYMP